MKIALITRRFPPLIGGAEKVLSYLAPALAAEGAEVTVVTSAIPGRDLPEDDGPVPVVRLTTASTRFVGTWIYMRNLSRWLARNPVDVAYVSMLKHDAYVAVGAGKRLGFPVVMRRRARAPRAISPGKRGSGGGVPSAGVVARPTPSSPSPRRSAPS